MTRAQLLRIMRSTDAAQKLFSDFIKRNNKLFNIKFT